MSKGNFLPFLIDILKETDYVDVASVEKHPSEWTVFDDREELKPFGNWFINYIARENCLTTDEMVIYHDLKYNNKIVPDDETDQLLQEYFNIESLGDFSKDNIKHSIAVAELELQSLKSLEDFINEQERKLEKTHKVTDELNPFIKSELKELEISNNLYNEALYKYTDSWDDLKVQLSQQNDKELCLNEYLNMIFLNNKINQNLNEHLKTDFQEVKPIDGKMSISPVDYWIVYKKLSEVRNEIIHITATIQGKSLIKNYLQELEHIVSINHNVTSLSDIKKFFSEVPSQNEKLTELLSIVLEDEAYCLLKIQINDTKKCSAFLEDRYDRLSKIENILQSKRILNDAFKFIIKREKVIRDYQVAKLNQYSKNIESLVVQHEHRIERMKNHKNVCKIISVDPNYKALMKCFGLQTSDYNALSTEIENLKENIHISFANLKENICSFQNKFTESLHEINKNDKLLNDGPTREMFGHIFNNYIADLKDNSKRQKKMFETFIKIEKMLKEHKIGSGKKQCIWINCLKNPKDFLKMLHRTEKETVRLMERLKIEVMNQQ